MRFRTQLVAAANSGDAKTVKTLVDFGTGIGHSLKTTEDFARKGHVSNSSFDFTPKGRKLVINAVAQLSRKR